MQRLGLLLLLLSTFAHGGALGLSMGWGQLGTEGRLMQLSYQDRLLSSYFYRVEAGTQGVWALGGFQINPGRHTYVSFAVGGGLTAVDSRLSSALQFTEELMLGVEDRAHFIGVGWKHISCANLCVTNSGRDFLLLEVGFEL